MMHLAHQHSAFWLGFAPFPVKDNFPWTTFAKFDWKLNFLALLDIHQVSNWNLIFLFLRKSCNSEGWTTGKHCSHFSFSSYFFLKIHKMVWAKMISDFRWESGMLLWLSSGNKCLKFLWSIHTKMAWPFFKNQKYLKNNVKKHAI